MLWLLMLLPVAGAATIVLLGHSRRIHGLTAVVSLLLTLGVGVWAATAEATAALRWSSVIGLHLSVEGFSRVMVVLVPAIAVPIVFHAAVTEHDGHRRLLALMVAFVGAMELLVTAADFTTLLMGWELIGALSWALISHSWRDVDNPRAAAQAFVTTRVGDLGLYLAAGFAYAGTGSLAFDRLGAAPGAERAVVAFGVLLAAAAKSAQLPFSPWLFSAMAGPTPVSALLHSATLVAAGAYLLIRLAPVLDGVAWFDPAVTTVGLATALAGGAVALTQTQAKRVLAGSTSAQYGLMFVAVGASSTAAAGAQLMTHAAFKSLLFLGAGIAIHAVGSGELADMRLGRRIVVMGRLSAIGALALAAVPPLGGAWSKEQITSAGFHASTALGLGIVVASFLTAMYATRYQLLAYGPARAANESTESRFQAPELVGPAVLAVFTVALAVLWLPAGRRVVEGATLGALPEGRLGEQVLSVVAIAAGAGVAMALWRRGPLLTLGLPRAVRVAAAGWFGLPAAARRVVVDPVLRLARLLAGFDDRVIDAGVRVVARLAAFVSRLLSVRVEWTVDRVVRAIASATLRLAARTRVHAESAVDRVVEASAAATVLAATGSRVTDERVIDGLLVEGTAGGVGVAGRIARRLQTGFSHHYLLLVAGGFVVIAFALVAWR